MDASKIAIILLNISEEYVELMQQYLNALRKPEGYEVELVICNQDHGMTHAFAEGMVCSDAKYKVYIPPDTIIIYENIFEECLRIFKRDKHIGAIGVLGAHQLSTTTEIFKSYGLQGRILFRDGEQKIYSGSRKGIQILSENLLITQYDVSWRETQYTEQDYVFRAQSIEFTRKGYKLSVPEQEDFWIIGAKENIIGEENKQAFHDEYAEDIFPLVTVIIPTYERRDYFKQALDSVLSQDYKNLDIFITDNSNSDDTEQLMKAHYLQDKRIKYIHHPEWGLKENTESAMGYNNPKADYVNWLMDDDLFLPGKISTMMEYFFQHPKVGIVTSYRGLINENGDLLHDRHVTLSDGSETLYLTGEEAGRQMLVEVSDNLGEPTTPLLKKKYMRDGYTMGWEMKEGLYFIIDFTTWLKMLTKCDCIFILKSYSYFRVHDGSMSKTLFTQCAISICWAYYIRKAINEGLFLTNDEEKNKSISTWLSIAEKNLKEAIERDYHGDEIEDLRIVYAAMEKALNNGYYIEFKLEG